MPLTVRGVDGGDYLDIDKLVDLIDEPQATGCRALLEAHRTRFEEARGSSHNHQAWVGGYLDHLREVMNIALELFSSLDRLRPLPFTRSDVLLVLFVHDLEKPWRHVRRERLGSDDEFERRPLDTHAERQEFRLAVAKRYSISLAGEQIDAVDFIEGEGDRYSFERRGMSELACFCHVCDTLSARLWHDRPLTAGERWGRRGDSGAGLA